MNMFTLERFFFIYERIGGRYFIAAGIAFLVCYVLLRKKISAKKIQSKFPKTKDYLREIGYSIITIAIFAIVALLIFNHPKVAPHTLRYNAIDAYGWWYYAAMFPVMLFLHDTYFYWAHRAMHHPALFKWVHLVHHQSTNPSPWAAYAFHPLESVVEAGIIIIFAFSIPLHFTHFLFFFLFMILYNVYGHLGWELYPKNFNRTRIGRYINTSVNHNQHHQYFKGNYSLYFLWWDRWMGTIRSDYDQRFDEVKSK